VTSISPENPKKRLFPHFPVDPRKVLIKIKVLLGRAERRHDITTGPPAERLG
jgi:hypothetical protein